MHLSNCKFANEMPLVIPKLRFIYLSTDSAVKRTRECTLMGTWIDTTVRKGDIVNVLGLDETKSDWVINDLNGLLVINPDLLISGTSIVSTLFCMRKAVLNERFKASIC